jgi:Tfp pilus assembly protein PilF
MWEAEGPEHLYLTAVAALERGDTERARRLFELILLDDPRFAPAWDGIAGCHEADGDLERAGDCYARAMRLDRNGWRSRYNWGAALHRAGELDEACRWLREAARRAPKERLIAYRMGQCCFDVGDFDEAVSQYHKALEMEERAVTDTEILIALGDAEAERGELEAADRAYERACLLSPDDARVFYRWALLSARAEEVDAAERLAYRAVCLDPRSVLYRQFRLGLALDRGDIRGAEQQIDELASLPDTGRLVLALRAEVARRAGAAEAARELALETLRLAGPPSDQAVDRALSTLRELLGVEAPCRAYRILMEVEAGTQSYFRPFVVLAEDERGARELAIELQEALDPNPWRIAESESFPHDGSKCLVGVYQLLLTRVLFDREPAAPEQSPA